MNGMMMEEGQIYQRLNEIFGDVFDDDALALKAETTADDVDGWDSLSHIRLVLSVEKSFNVKFSAAEVGKLKNVGELVGLIRSKL
jgi:acyl carrier protein